MMVQGANHKSKRKRKNVASDKPPLSSLDADEFMASFIDSDVSDSEPEQPVKAKKKKRKTKKETPAGTPPTKPESSDITPNKENSTKSKPKTDVKQGLSRLQENDSEFYKFLQKNDPELLNFSGDDSDVSESDLSDVERSVSDEDQAQTTKQAQTVSTPDAPIQASDSTFEAIPVTKALLRKWETGLKNNSLPQWKQLVKAFQAAVVTAKGDDAEVTMKYSIIDPAMVNNVITLALQYSADLLEHHLGDNPTCSQKWSKVKMSLKAYLTNLTDLLGLLTSNDVLCAVMRHCKVLLPYYKAFSRLVKKFVKSHIAIWGSKAELSRVVAFTSIHALILKVPAFLEDVLKKMYIEYTKCSKAMNVRSRDVIILMRNCLVELFKINPSITYTTGFLYIRQLAITLRSVIISKKKEVESVYNWQYVNCLHVWVGVLGDCDACLQPLIFPLIQIMMGVLKLHSSPCFFPLQLHVIRLMLHLAEQTDKHIPLAHPLLNTLDFCSTQHRAPATKPIDLTCVLRVTKGYKKTKAYQDGVFDLTYELLLNYISQLSGSISFPEVSFPLTVWLKKFNKSCDSGKYKMQIKQILEKIDIAGKDLSNRRSNVTFSPKDFAEVKKWENELPPSALTKYFNTWLRIHRKVQEHEEMKKGEEDEEEEEGAEVDNEETPVSPKKEKSSKKARKSGDCKKSDDVNESKKEPKKKLKKKKQKQVPVVTEEEFVDTGDLVEDMKLSDED